MADEGDILTDLNMDPGTPGAAPNGADNQPTAGIVSQYVKDLSVEVPNAPAAFQWKDAPSIDLQFNIGAEQVNDEIHEVQLQIKVSAKGENGTFYLVELTYCGLIGMRNMPDDQSHAFLFAEAPRIVFPFARRVIADAVRDAGFPPLMMDPIDFNGLYVQQLQARAQEEGKTPAAPGEAN